MKALSQALHVVHDGQEGPVLHTPVMADVSDKGTISVSECCCQSDHLNQSNYVIGRLTPQILGVDKDF